MEETPHTLRAFDHDQNALRALIGQMGGRAEVALHDALESLLARDAEAAARVVEQDRLIDNLESEAEHFAFQMLALRAPMADDLREAIAILKIAGVIERIGDYAKNIAKRVPQFETPWHDEPIALLAEMARAAALMVHNALDAFVERDAEKARAVCDSDKLVDDFYNSVFRALLTFMTENPQEVGPATHLMFIAKNIERIGDHATNIAEMVYFTATGERLEERERGADPATMP